VDALVIGQVFVGLIVSAGGLWAFIQICAFIWSKKAGAGEVAALTTAVEGLRDDLHRYKNSAVHVSTFNERTLMVNQLLEDRRRGERELHERLNEHIEADTRMHSDVLEKLGEIGSAVARIEGRLDK
jgi:hypothetical protein